MKLFGTGFNAWNQLRVTKNSHSTQPDDLYHFELILEGDHIEAPSSTLSYTSVKCDGKHYTAGHGVPSQDNTATGATQHPLLAENFAGEILRVETESPSHDESPGVFHLVKNTNKSRPGTDESTRQSWPRPRPIAQLAAFHVGFIILYEDGSVESMGDPRFPDCLGREVDDDHPAEEPHSVTALNDLGDPVKKVATGGYTAAALTQSGALYVWGMRPPGSGPKQQTIPGLNDIPNYIEVDGDKDVEDIAVGEFHAITLTTEGCVYVTGRNENGQLGLGADVKGSSESWTKVSLDIAPQDRVISVASGPRSSFILVASQVDPAPGG